MPANSLKSPAANFLMKWPGTYFSPGFRSVFEPVTKCNQCCFTRHGRYLHGSSETNSSKHRFLTIRYCLLIILKLMTRYLVKLTKTLTGTFRRHWQQDTPLEERAKMIGTIRRLKTKYCTCTQTLVTSISLKFRGGFLALKAY